MDQPKYRVEVRPSVEKDFKQIDECYHRLIWRRIEALGDDSYPRGSLQMEGEESVRRIRVGVYRIFYSVDAIERLVLILKISHRQSAYKK